MGSAGCAASLCLGCSRPQSHAEVSNTIRIPHASFEEKRASSLLLLDAVTFVIFRFAVDLELLNPFYKRNSSLRGNFKNEDLECFQLLVIQLLGSHV